MPDSKITKTHILIPLVLILPILIIHHFFPVTWLFWTTEDGPLEYGTFVFFMMAGVMLASLMVRNPEYRKLFYFLFLAFLFFVGMEEISWGERIHHIRGPWRIRLANMQGESNLHNLPALHSSTYNIFITINLLWGILLPFLVRRISRLKDLCTKFGVPLVQLSVVPCFVLVLILQFSYPMARRFEVSEFFFGFGILYYVFNLTVANQKKEISAQSKKLRAGVLALIFLVTTIGLTVFYPDHYTYKFRLNYGAASLYPKCGWPKQGAIAYEYLLKNPRLILLDPWHATLKAYQDEQNAEQVALLEEQISRLLEVQEA